MAWCVGSVFPTPQLLTGPALPPFGSLLLGPPQCLLNTGCELHYGADQQSNPHRQAESFLHEYKEAFVPQELLIDNLQEDASSHSAISRSFYSVGNRLEGVKNRDGSLQLFFPVGDNIDRIGSCSLPLEWNATSSRKYLHQGYCNNVPYSSSSSVCQPILQIAADKGGLSWGSELTNVPLAARTLYQVHWLTSGTKNDKNLLDWRGVENFNYGTSHVVWNPHFPEEAAVLLENGDVTIFDLNSPGSHAVSSVFKVDERANNEGFSLSNLALSLKQKWRKKSVLDTSVTQNWWGCEYAWHPKNLIVGERKEVCLIDVREKGGGKQFQRSLARVHCSSKLFSHCNQIYKTEQFTALTRADYDNMFQFATASTNHVTVYDVRRPNSPLLQWEHRMQREPPRLLQMFCLTDVRSKFDNSLVKNATGGRVILACAFKSGEIEAFLYGPKPQTCPSYSESIKVEQAMDTFEELYAWEFPKKLKNWNAYSFKDLEHAFEAHENKLQTVIPKDFEIEQLSGLFTSFPHSDSSDFAILQLTGSGSILCQSLKLLEEVGSNNHELSGAVSKKRPMVRTSTGKCRTKHYRLEYLPAFMKYLQHGSILPKVRQNDSPNLTSATREECPMDTIEKEQQEELGKSAFDLDAHMSTSGDQEQPNTRRPNTAASMSCIGKKDCQESPFQGKNSGSHGDQNTEEFFHKMDTQLSLVKLSFTDKAHGTNLPAEELALLSGLKDLFYQWQQSFQPYVDHLSLDVPDNCQA